MTTVSGLSRGEAGLGESSMGIVLRRLGSSEVVVGRGVEIGELLENQMQQRLSLQYSLSNRRGRVRGAGKEAGKEA
eukprot:763054-Hanusia_phi.AAC.1